MTSTTATDTLTVNKRLAVRFLDLCRSSTA
jgi:hypothetical protein